MGDGKASPFPPDNRAAGMRVASGRTYDLGRDSEGLNCQLAFGGGFAPLCQGFFGAVA